MKMEFIAQVLRGWPGQQEGAREKTEQISVGATLKNGDLVTVQSDGTVAKVTSQSTRKAGLVIRGNGDSASAANAQGNRMTPGPALSISAISAWSAGYMTVTVANHGYSVGNLVTIAGVTTSAVNGNYGIQSITDANNFVIYLASTPGAITLGTATASVQSGVSSNGEALVLWGNYVVSTQNYNTSGTFVPGTAVTARNGLYDVAYSAVTSTANTSLTYSSGTGLVTVTVSGGHGLGNNQTVTIAGVTPTGYNGTYVVTVTGSTTFTYVATGALATETVPGTYVGIADAELGFVTRVQGVTSTESAHLDINVY